MFKKKLITLMMAGVLAIGGISGTVLSKDTEVVNAEEHQCKWSVGNKIYIGLGEKVYINDLCDLGGCKNASVMNSKLSNGKKGKVLKVKNTYIKGLKRGSCQLYLKTSNKDSLYSKDGAVKQSCITVVVKKAPKSVKFKKSVVYGKRLEQVAIPKLKFSKGSYSFTQSVSAHNGKLKIGMSIKRPYTCKMAGVTEVTVTTYNGKKAKLEIHVSE